MMNFYPTTMPATERQRRPVPAGCGQCGRHKERTPPSNVVRFPVIGAHLIDGNTPAFARTEPPQADEACVGAVPAGQHRTSALIRFTLWLRRLLD